MRSCSVHHAAACLAAFFCLPVCLFDCLCPSQRASCVLLAWWRAGRRSSSGSSGTIMAVSQLTNETALVAGAAKGAVLVTARAGLLRVWVPCVGPLSAYVARFPLSPWLLRLSCCTSARHSRCAVCVLPGDRLHCPQVLGLCLFQRHSRCRLDPLYSQSLCACCCGPFGGSASGVFSAPWQPNCRLAARRDVHAPCLVQGGVLARVVRVQGMLQRLSAGPSTRCAV